MTDLGYTPERIAALGRAVHLALNELHGLRCTDPAGDDAMRIVNLTAHNLERTWIPTLVRIESSSSMAVWTPAATGLGSSAWSWATVGATAGVADPPAPDSSGGAAADPSIAPPGADPVVALAAVAGALRFGPDGRPVEGDLHGPGHVRLIDALMRRLAIDPASRHAVLAVVRERPEAAWLLTDPRLDPDLRGSILREVLAAVRATPGHGWERLSTAADALMTDLVHDPAAALRVLRDPVTLDALASWEVLDQDVVADFVHAGLATSAVEEQRHHATGVAVLVQLTELANTTRIDHPGFQPGLASGVARSIGLYAPSFIDTVGYTGGTVAIRSDGPDGRFDVTLGTNEEVVDLFGAVLHNSPGAGEHLGVEVASLARLAVAEVPDLPVAVRVDTVAEFADLLRRAAANEEAELTIAASARRAAMRESAMLFGLSAAATLVLTRSAGPAARLLLERGISDGVTLATRPRPAPGVDAPDYGKATHDVMVTAAARRLIGDAALRERYAPDADPAAWHGVRAVLAQLERSADGDPAEVDRLVYDVEARVRTLGAGRYLDELLQRPAVHRLTKSAADPD